MQINLQTSDSVPVPLHLHDCTINLRVGGIDHHHFRDFSVPGQRMTLLESTEVSAEPQRVDDSPRYLKLDASNQPLDIGAADYASVIDRQTGLQWSITLPGERLNHGDAEKACAELRTGEHSDWRLPTRQELQTLLDLSQHDPAADPTVFPDMKPQAYWSGCRLAADPDCAWIVHFYHGNVNGNHRDANYARVRAVRVAAPSPRQ